MTNLHKHVQEWIDKKDEEGYEGALDDLFQHGCQSGMVSHLITYTDTVKFYEEHQREIDEMLQEVCEDCGCRPDELFGDKWDSSDPLARDTLNQNLLAWFGFEGMAMRISDEREHAA